MIQHLNLCLRSREMSYISLRRNIQTLILLCRHDSSSEFILLGLGHYFYPSVPFCLLVSQWGVGWYITQAHGTAQFGHGSQVRSYLWVVTGHLSPLALFPPQPNTPPPTHEPHNELSSCIIFYFCKFCCLIHYCSLSL